MKIFVSYKFTGEDPKKLRKKLLDISNIIKELGHESFILWKDLYDFNMDEKDYRILLKQAFEHLRKSNCLLVLADSPHKSEGQLIETGYAKALNKKIIVAIKSLDHTYFLKNITDEVFLFKNIEDLKNKLKRVLQK